MAECTGGRGVSPYFTTRAGRALQTILFGFGAFETTDEGLKKRNNRLPNAWTRFEIHLTKD
ncbi:MAG: hypothetical protein AAF985_01610 [Bacteroidota bacterium]